MTTYYIDTHTHLYDEKLMEEEEQMIQRALDANVRKMYMPNCDSETITPMMHLAKKYPDHCMPMMGLHPCYVKENYLEELKIAAEWLAKEKFYAIGEIGLDYYWDLSFKEQQKKAFELQIDWALEQGLPIVIHSRESTQDCIDIVRSKQTGELKGIFHCFSGTVDEAKQVVSLGFYLGIGGVVTYKKTNLPEVITAAGIENIVLETDAPYLAPVPYRGKRNESSYIPAISESVSKVLGISTDEVRSVTTKNALSIFKK
ncbi:MAG TPA: TatD family hydrolase [Flavipsychrobacter sp.]|nr:TatD family hydrolase [Flavipsychrobacter sp.]